MSRVRKEKFLRQTNVRLRLLYAASAAGVLEYILSANLQTKGGQIRLKTKWQLNVVSKETKSLLMFDDPISKIPPKLTQIISSDMKSDLNCAGLPVRWPRP